ncbi:ABC transporter substrate-binding protein [Salinispirillum sp. LH 10-3-1]|uniref:ABC transporter substrate-binding protein n=1 Tax=Salinispirillum sp. LH 10-3-1 TaxID=2952525 RepID=A0AB38YG98_9GAMM
MSQSTQSNAIQSVRTQNFSRTGWFPIILVTLLLNSAWADSPRPIAVALLEDDTPVFRDYTEEQHLGFLLGLEYLTEGSMEWQGRPVSAHPVPAGGWFRDENYLPDAHELPDFSIWIAPVQARYAHRAMQYGQAYQRLTLVPASPANQLPVAQYDLAFRTFYRWQDVEAGLYEWASEQEDLIWVSAVDSSVRPDFFRVANIDVSPRSSGASVIAEVDDLARLMKNPALGSTWPVLLDWLPMLSDDVGLASQNMYFWLPDLASLVPLREFSGLQGLTYYYYDLPNNDANTWLVRTMLERHDRLPSHYVVAGMTAAMALLTAVAEADTVDAEQLAAHLPDMAWDSPRGVLSFTAAGETRQPLYRTELRLQRQLEWARPVELDGQGPYWTQP